MIGIGEPQGAKEVVGNYLVFFRKEGDPPPYLGQQGTRKEVQTDIPSRLFSFCPTPSITYVAIASFQYRTSFSPRLKSSYFGLPNLPLLTSSQPKSTHLS